MHYPINFSYPSNSVCMLLRTLRKPNGLAEAAKRVCKTKRGGEKQTVVIDYSSPNIAKQFHVGNLRSTLIGRYVDKVHRYLGDDVVSVNYLGDWGTQFAMIAAYWPQSRPSDAFWSSLSDSEKIKMLTECYVVANRMCAEEEFRSTVRDTFHAMEKDVASNSHTSDAMLLWRDIREISENHLKQFYSVLDIQFDRFLYESEEVSEANRVVNTLIDKGIARKTDDGLWVADCSGSAHSSSTNPEEYCILSKSDDTTLYLTRDIASILRRQKLWNANQYMYVVDRAQRKHFQNLRIVLDKMGHGDLAEKIVHVPYGRVKGLSTRKGRTEAVSEIIENGSELAREFIINSPTIKVEDHEVDELCNRLSLDTIIVNDLKRAKNAEYEFSFKNAFALNQNNALLLQEKHSRLFSIEQRNSSLLPLIDECDTVPEGDVSSSLINHLQMAPDVIVDSANSLEPCQLTVYLIHLAHLSGKAANRLKVMDEPSSVSLPRLSLLSSARHTLSQGMSLLGIQPVDRIWEFHRYADSCLRISQMESRQWNIRENTENEEKKEKEGKMRRWREILYWKWRRLTGRRLTPLSHFSSKSSHK